MKKTAPVPSGSASLVDPEINSPANGGPARKEKNRLAEVARLRQDDGNGHSDSNLNDILRSLTALKKGHFAERLPLHWSGVSGKIADVFNQLAELM